MEIGVNVMTRDGKFLFGESSELGEIIFKIVQASELLYTSIGKALGKIEIDLDKTYIYIYVLRRLIVYADSELSERDLIKIAKKYAE